MAQGFDRVGLIRSRPRCCLFTWRDSGMIGSRKTVELHDEHCEPCIDELRRVAPAIRLVDRRVPAPSTVRSVLVVDDDVEIRDELYGALSELGWQVTCAADGAEALAYLRSGAPLPRVILLDMMMPVMDGNEFRVHQRRDPALAEIPVVVVTAGRDAPRSPAPVVQKPFRMDVITRAIERQLSRA